MRVKEKPKHLKDCITIKIPICLGKECQEITTQLCSLIREKKEEENQLLEKNLIEE